MSGAREKDSSSGNTIVMLRGAATHHIREFASEARDRLVSSLDVPVSAFTRDHTLSTPSGGQGYDTVLVVHDVVSPTALRALTDAAAAMLTVDSNVVIDRPTPPDSVHSFVTLRRHPALAHDEFASYWASRHAPLVLVTTDVADNMTYYAQHVVRGPAGDDSVIDGVAQSSFASVDAMKRIFRSPQRPTLADDERRFLDGPRCVVTLCRRVDV